jgi:endonuclease YncB( thermonuclease family)
VRHNCRITRIIDADTFRGVVDLDFGISLSVTVRLFDCDAYEMTGSDKPRGLAAKEYVETMLGGSTVIVDPHKQDSFGRWLCDVYFKGESLKTILSEHGYLKQKPENNKPQDNREK